MILRLSLLLLLLCSCHGTKKQNTAIQVCVLHGPSAIAFAQLIDSTARIDGRNLSIRLIDSPEIMQSCLIRGEADIAVLPMISAANLYNKGIRYELLGCPLWGTLYLVGRTDSLSAQWIKENPLYLFGAGTTPDILTRYYLEQNNIPITDIQLNYAYPSARETMQALLADRANFAVLSEPFLSIALKKDSTLQMLADLNNPNNTLTGFPQTAIVISPELKPLQAQLDSLINASCTFATTHPEEAIRILEANKVFAPGMLTSTAIARCNVQYSPAARCKEEIYAFLDIILRIKAPAIGKQLPDNSFISTAP